MKTCSKCNQTKSESEFNKKKKSLDGLNCQCRQCENQSGRNHYNKNKKYYIDKAANQVQKMIDWFENYKSKCQCEICGESHPSTFDFHHIDSSQKDDCISILVRRGSMKRLQKELPKCKVFCANCHRKFHWNEKQNLCRRSSIG